MNRAPLQALLLLLASLFAFPATAATEQHRQAANQLLDAMNINQLLAQSIEAMMQLELSKNPALLPFEGTMRSFFKKYMSGESLRPDFIDLYVATFSERELVELTRFYRSPIGRKALKTAPGLMAKGAAIGQQRVQENLPELQRMVAEEAQRLQQMQQQQAQPEPKPKQ